MASPLDFGTTAKLYWPEIYRNLQLSTGVQFFMQLPRAVLLCRFVKIVF